MTTMGKIGLALVLIGTGAVSLSGCGGGGCRDNVEVTWTLVDANNAVYQCEAVGAQTVVITMGGMSTTFNCNAYDGLTAPVRVGTYATSFKLLDGSGKLLSQAGPMNVTISGCGTISAGQVDFEIVPPATVCGTQDVSLTWTIVQDTTNQPLTCQTVGGSTVRLNLGNTPFDFSCAAGAGRTTAVPEGTYPTSVQLFDAGANLLSQTSTMNIIVPHCAGVSLPNIEFGVQ